MSVIFGLFHRDGKPVAGELETMYSGMRHFPHEKHAFAVQGNCGFGHMLTYNTPEAIRESMPRWIPSAGLLFTAEGRIDNRGELLSALDVSAAERADMPDGDLMLRAYLRWGEGCVERLAGKWSFAAFHTERQRLFLARDKWDYTDIQYYADDRVFAFSTSEKGLFPLPFIRREIDETEIAKLLILWRDRFDNTVYKNVKRLLPSRALRVTRGDMDLRRYWDFADVRVREGWPLKDCADELLDRLNEAVRARLRSHQPVAAMLSGGMDSGTVCVLAAEQLALRHQRLRTYSHVPQYAPSAVVPPRRFGDERPYIEAVAQAAGNIDPVFLDSAGISPLEGVREALRLAGAPFHGAANMYWLADIFHTAVNENVGTLLLGEFGNATISWKGAEDALPVNALRKRRGLIAAAKIKLLDPVLYGDTPPAALYKRLKCGARPWKDRSYCTREFEKSLRLARQTRASGVDPAYRRYFADPQGYRLRLLELGAPRLVFGAAVACETGLEFRDPTGDPRVIETALAVPNEAFFGDADRWVLRTMTKGMLPDAVRLNTRKGLQSADIQRRLFAHREEMDRVLAAMKASEFSRIADVGRMAADWERLQADCDRLPHHTAAQLLRHVAAYELYQTLRNAGA